MRRRIPASRQSEVEGEDEQRSVLCVSSGNMQWDMRLGKKKKWLKRVMCLCHKEWYSVQGFQCEFVCISEEERKMTRDEERKKDAQLFPRAHLHSWQVYTNFRLCIDRRIGRAYNGLSSLRVIIGYWPYIIAITFHSHPFSLTLCSC